MGRGGEGEEEDASIGEKNKIFKEKFVPASFSFPLIVHPHLPYVHSGVCKLIEQPERGSQNRKGGILNKITEREDRKRIWLAHFSPGGKSKENRRGICLIVPSIRLMNRAAASRRVCLANLKCSVFLDARLPYTGLSLSLSLRVIRIGDYGERAIYKYSLRCILRPPAALQGIRSSSAGMAIFE